MVEKFGNERKDEMLNRWKYLLKNAYVLLAY